jgi:hypothetical protein
MAKPTQADLNAAARGLRMVSMDVYELQELVKEFKTKGTFAADVIVQAAQQILAVKKRNYARNPQPRRKPTKRAKSYITRPSQATHAAPSKRLKARRAKVASGSAPKGYFPNPTGRSRDWLVQHIEGQIRGFQHTSSNTLAQAQLSYCQGWIEALYYAGIFNLNTNQQLFDQLNEAKRYREARR